MIRVLPDLPGWTFEVDEVSAGVYEVVASDRHGHTFSNKGTDPDALLKVCSEQARGLIHAARDPR